MDFKLFDIIDSFISVNYYETIEFLLDYIEFDEQAPITYIDAYDDFMLKLIYQIFYYLRTPTTKAQQIIQFRIIKKLIKSQSIHAYIHLVNTDHLLPGIIISLNIPLVDFIFKEINITDINVLFYGHSALQWIAIYLAIYPNKNNDFAYEMFDHLLSIGSDFIFNDIYIFIRRIADQNIQNTLIEIVQKHRTSKFLLTKDQKEFTKNKLNEMITNRINSKYYLAKDRQ